MKLALFSDVHGRLRLVLHLIRCWQMAHRTELDGALIAGDLGCFPDPTKFDKATRRWIERDPEEAGFSRFFVHPQPEVAAMLAPEFGPLSAVRCPIIFVAGNHEDHDYLGFLRNHPPAPKAPDNTFPVDCYCAFHCLRDGFSTEVHGQDGLTLRIAGIWGIEDTRPGAPYRISPAAVEQLTRRGDGAIDILLTHDAPAEIFPSGGSAMVTKAIRTCQPHFHLFGHVHPPHGQHEFGLPGLRTKSWILKDLSFGRDGSESLAGTMAILDWTENSKSIQLANDWLSQMRLGSWQQILPTH
jgi:Icc-related predicted phosphoesterase